MTKQELGRMNLGTLVKSGVVIEGPLSKDVDSSGADTNLVGDYDKFLKENGSVYRRSIIEADPGTRHSSLDDNGE